MQNNLPYQKKDSLLTQTQKSNIHPSEIRGEVLRIVYSSADSDYCVIKILTSDNQEVTVTGTLLNILEGQNVIIQGHWESHKDYGKQFKMKTFQTSLPCTKKGICKYLASGLIPGIGPKIAERIVDHFGVKTLSILDNYSARLSEISGLGKGRLKQIKKSWDEHSKLRNLYVFMQGLGVTPAYCSRIYQQYGEAASEIIKKTPYKLADDVNGIGFLMADNIAMNSGIAKDSIHRLSAGILYVLKTLNSSGHVCYPKAKLIEKAKEYLNVEEHKIESALDVALLNNLIAVDTPENILKSNQKNKSKGKINTSTPQEYFYTTKSFYAEKKLAEKILLFLKQKHKIKQKTLPVSPYLSLEQQIAVQNAFINKISIITGGPGVGKTTTISEIVKLAQKYNMKISLAAPTGRAAKRMSESCSITAKTIHRLLRWDPKTYTFIFNEDIPLKCDLLIIDEASMLDIFLANSLFQAISHKTSLVLIGDKDQLPSVGPGSVLNNLIASKKIPTTFLKQIFRQENTSKIITNSHLVNQGRLPELQSPEQPDKTDFFWVSQEDPNLVNENIKEMIKNRIPNRFNFDPMNDIQLIVPMRKGTCGTNAMNKLIQEALNPKLNKAEFLFGEKIFRLGDRVMQIVNNYDKCVFNGDLGRIKSIDSINKKFKIKFDNSITEYDFKDAEQITLAYAITVHKSQGSEFPVVIMPILTQHYIMLQRNLIYTAMTRAKKLLILIGSTKAISIAVNNTDQAMRYSLLKLRLTL